MFDQTAAAKTVDRGLEGAYGLVLMHRGHGAIPKVLERQGRHGVSNSQSRGCFVGERHLEQKRVEVGNLRACGEEGVGESAILGADSEEVDIIETGFTGPVELSSIPIFT